MQSHLTAAATYVEHPFMRLKSAKQLQVRHELSAGSLEASEWANVPSQMQWRQIAFAIKRPPQVIEWG
jgi:hypothetical protein